MDRQKALVYWNALFEDRIIEGQSMECRAIKQGANEVQHFKEAEPMLTWTESSLEKGFNLYAGVNLRNGKGGKKEDITAVNAFHIDLDYGTQGHKQENSLTENDARSLLKEFEFQPTLIVNSGGGFHAYWALERPITDPTLFNTTELINKGLALALRGDQCVADITRILRIPGTYNFNLRVPSLMA